MSNPTRTRMLSLYRSLLRELPPRPPSAKHTRSPLHRWLRQDFSKHANPANQANHERAIAQTDQLLQYLKAQRTYAALVERYNPGMNMDEEERVRLTARRVGMDLPVEYTQGEKQE